MWPEPGEALSHTIAAEAAVEDLYAEALRRWLPTINTYVLPALAAATLPPDPQAVAQGQSSWTATAKQIVLRGLSMLWAATAVKALQSLGIELPEITQNPAAHPDPIVTRIVHRAVDGMDADELHAADELVYSVAALANARDEFLTTQSAEADKIPGQVAEKIEMAIRDAEREHATPDEQRAEQAAAAKIAIEPGSQPMREVARVAGYQAAAVQNDAVLQAAKRSEDADELDKIWLATLDGRTRPGHFAADGQRTPLASSFTVSGEQLEMPGDPSASPGNRINCRCRMGVLAHDEELPDEVDRHTERPGIASSTEVNRDGRTQAQEIEKRAGEGTVRAREDPEGLGRTAAVKPIERDDMTTMTSKSAAFKVGDVDAYGNTVVAEGYTTDDGRAVFTADDGSDMYRTFTDAVVAKLGEQTSDGRMLAAKIDLSFREMPLPLMWMKQTGSGMGGHTEAYTVGVIESAKVSGSDILASGYILNTPEADEAAEQIGHGVTEPSVDLGAVEWMLTDEDGKEISEEDWWDLPMDAPVIQTITAAELIGTTLVSTPAFGTTKITLDADRSSREPSLVASAAAEFRPPVYDHRLFENPKLSGPTLPTMGEDGRIYGHLACFGACHRSIQSECIVAPKSRSGYANFHTSPAVKLDNDTRLPVGRLTVGTGHASDKLRPGPAMAHYDNTGTCFALVRVGEDSHGIWFSGVAAPWATAEQVQMGISSPLSGDWRDFGQGLELIAALAVNTPGFAARGKSDEQGRPLSLVASIGPSPRTQSGGGSHLTLADIKTAVREAMVEQHKLSSFAAERDAVLAKAAQITRPPTPNEEIAALLAGITPTANDGGLPTQIDVDPMDNASPVSPGLKISAPMPTRKPTPNTVAGDVTNGTPGTINAPIPPAMSNPKPSPLTGAPVPSAGTGTPS